MSSYKQRYLLFSQKGGWTCPTCTLENNPEALFCEACHTERITGKVYSESKVIPSSLSASTSSVAKPWICPTCTFENTKTSTKCEVCDALKPTVKPESKDDEMPQYVKKLAEMSVLQNKLSEDYNKIIKNNIFTTYTVKVKQQTEDPLVPNAYCGYYTAKYANGIYQYLKGRLESTKSINEYIDLQNDIKNVLKNREKVFKELPEDLKYLGYDKTGGNLQVNEVVDLLTEKYKISKDNLCIPYDLLSNAIQKTITPCINRLFDGTTDTMIFILNTIEQKDYELQVSIEKKETKPKQNLNAIAGHFFTVIMYRSRGKIWIFVADSASPEDKQKYIFHSINKTPTIKRLIEIINNIESFKNWLKSKKL